jgi:hypothetical protein
MFKKLFSSYKPEAARHLVVAHLNDRCQPIDRGRYEDPLDDFLRTNGLGEVTGGGTSLMETGEVDYCDVEVQLASVGAEVLEAVATQLEAAGAPKGSKLVTNDGTERPIGHCEGLAVYLNGTDLGAEVYENCDVNFVYSEFDRLLEGKGSVHSHWHGPTETALYMYGESYEAMRTALSDFMASYPLCAKARVEQVA